MFSTKKLPIPWFTGLVTLVSIALFIVFNFIGVYDMSKREFMSVLGAPYAIQIYQGQYWGIFTNSFLHINVFHLFFNLLGLWLFSAFIERRITFFRLFLLGFFASTTTSLIQLTLSDDAGIGLSGVNYFLLSFVLGKSIKNDDFKLKFRYIYLIVASAILGLSIYLNIYQGYNIGTEAMIAGLILGFIVGLISEFSQLSRSILAYSVIALSCISTLFYSPWSAEWNYAKGYQAHIDQNFELAREYYKKSSLLNPKHSFAAENEKLVTIELLSDKAMDAHLKEDYLKARYFYNKILDIDPNNSWAKENRRKLP